MRQMANKETGNLSSGQSGREIALLRWTTYRHVAGARPGATSPFTLRPSVLPPTAQSPDRPGTKNIEINHIFIDQTQSRMRAGTAGLAGGTFMLPSEPR
jgi:hypothetical protein